MRYEAATRYLYALAPRGMMLGLERFERALALRGHPERAFRSVVVAGTNGKGSVAAMLASVLSASGLRVGLYTSPHLHRLVERFRIDGRPLPQRELAERVSQLAPFLEAPDTPPLTFFEVCTLIAFESFRDRRCDFAVLEVGLGGRLDATNLVTPVASVITRIAMDHADRLGPTLAHIAREKAGIIKPGVPVVSSVREPQARRVISARAHRLAAPLTLIGRDFEVDKQDGAFGLTLGASRVERLRVPLRGDHQADNLACAVATVEVLRARGVSVDEPALRRGLARVRWPGRLEAIPGHPTVLLDAAHNPDACRALASYLTGLHGEYSRRVLLLGVLRDKDYAEMIDLLRPEVDDVIFSTPKTPRALPAGELAARFGGRAQDDPRAAFSAAKKLAGKRGLVIVAGSIFLMATIRARLLGLKADPPIAL